MPLIMNDRGVTSTGRLLWQIKTADAAGVEFPADERLNALFKMAFPVHGELSVVERRDDSVLVETLIGLTRRDCEPFLRILWEEAHFK